MSSEATKKNRLLVEKERTPVEKRRTIEDRTDEYLRLSKELYINSEAAVSLKLFRSLLVDLNRFLVNEGVIGYQELKMKLKAGYASETEKEQEQEQEGTETASDTK
jgi:hypothetical protein